MESHKTHEEIVDGLKSSDNSTLQTIFAFETSESTLCKNSDKPSKPQISSDLKPFPFMRLPFDIRRLIYEELYPTKQTIEVTLKDTDKSSFRPGGVYKLAKASTAFLRICRQINDEAYDVLYGMNKIVFWPKSENLIWSPAENRVSINALPPSICQKISELQIVLDGKIDVLEMTLLLKVLPCFPRVLITIMTFMQKDLPCDGPEDNLRNMLLERLRIDCKEIACARAKSGLTLWDDLEEPDFKWMLEGALPEGYQKGVCLGLRDWWKGSDWWRKSLWL